MFTIISSLYKSDKYLPKFSARLLEFADGLKNQHADFELIAIANDPTEAEKKFAQDFAKHSWFKFISIGREPLYATWNRGVGLARGEIIGFWNVDDVRYPEALIEAQRLFEQGNELVYFPFKIGRYFKLLGKYFLVGKQTIDSQIPEFNHQTRPEFSRSMLCGPFFLFKKTFYGKVGPFDEQFKIAGDFDWCARAAKISDKFVKAKSVAGEFRVDGGGLSAGGSPRQIAENNIIYTRNHVWDKIQIAQDLLIIQYRAKHISFEGKFIPINQLPQ